MKTKMLIIFNIFFLTTLILFFSFISIKKSVVKNSVDNVVHARVGEIYQHEKITGSLTSVADGLGSLSVNFLTFGRINKDVVLFRIKEVGNNEWIYQNRYYTDQFQSGQFFPFGFPPIKNSNKKSYYFEIESLNGTKGNAIGLNNNKRSIIETYAYAKNSLLHKRTLFLSIFLLHVNEYTHNIYFILCLIIFYIGSILVIEIVDKVIKRKNKKAFLRGIRGIKGIKGLLRNRILLIVFFGLLLRVLLALGPYNLDIANFVKDSLLFQQGKLNIYLYQDAYNYSPVMYYVVGLVGLIPKLVPILPFPFVFRTFLSLIDIGIFFVIMKIAKLRKLSPIKTGALFFLNPVSIIITGHHGQFDNVSLFFLLLAVWFSMKTKGKSVFWEWMYLTFAVVLKHIVIFFPITFWRSEGKNIKKTLLLFICSVGLFLATFIPFLSAEKEIIQQVFRYGGAQGFYGISYYLPYWINSFRLFGLDALNAYRYVFIAGMLIFSLTVKVRDTIRALLLFSLFFFSFTSGIALQYFIIPIIFGVFFPTKWFFFYSVIVALAFLGGLEQQFPFLIPGLSVISWNDIWIFSILWFGFEFLQVMPFTKKNKQK